MQEWIQVQLHTRFSESAMPNVYGCAAKVQWESDALVLGVPVGCLNLRRGLHIYRRYGDRGLHIYVDMGTGDLQSRGSPYSRDTGPGHIIISLASSFQGSGQANGDLEPSVLKQEETKISELGSAKEQLRVCWTRLKAGEGHWHTVHQVSPAHPWCTWYVYSCVVSGEKRASRMLSMQRTRQAVGYADSYMCLSVAHSKHSKLLSLLPWLSHSVSYVYMC